MAEILIAVTCPELSIGTTAFHQTPVALLEEHPWQEVVAWASAATALKTTELGAQARLSTRDQVLAVLAKNEIKS